jgi:hypothetical protein
MPRSSQTIIDSGGTNILALIIFDFAEMHGADIESAIPGLDFLTLAGVKPTNKQ